MITKFLCAALFVGSIAAPYALPQERKADKRERDVHIETGDAKNVRIELDSREGTTRLIHKSSEDGVEAELNIKGVRFRDDYTDVESITPDGFFLLQEARAGVRRKLEIEQDASGGLRYAYTLNGAPQAFDAEARRWLAQMLKERVEGGFDARQRVEKIYRTRGAGGVLEAARSIKTSYARALYLKFLLDIDKPDAETVRAVLQRTARDKFSDYERANLLSAIARQHLSGAQGRNDFFDAVGSIKSDYDRSRVLLALLKREGLGDEWTLHVVKALAATASDYEKARVLIAASKAHPANETIRTAIVEAASRIGSDYERNRVLAAVARTRKTTSTEL